MENNTLKTSTHTRVLFDFYVRRIQKNLKQIETKGFGIKFFEEHLIIYYHQISYFVSIIEDYDYVWFVSPFHDSHFTTPVKNHYSFMMVLQAIKINHERTQAN